MVYINGNFNCRQWERLIVVDQLDGWISYLSKNGSIYLSGKDTIPRGFGAIRQDSVSGRILKTINRKSHLSPLQEEAFPQFLARLPQFM